MQKITRLGVYGVAQKESKILLIRQRQGPYSGLLDFPGGGVEFGETPEQALFREFGEEVAMAFEKATLLEALTATTDVPEKGEREAYTFYQVGLIYRVQGLRLLENGKKEELPYIWVNLSSLPEKHCSPLLAKYRLTHKHSG